MGGNMRKRRRAPFGRECDDGNDNWRGETRLDLKSYDVPDGGLPPALSTTQYGTEEPLG